MPEKRKILLVENQKFQFERIVDFDCLRSYEILPQKEDYINFIDNIRVWVNTEYRDAYRETAIKFVEKYIKDRNIELIIMDHILGGAFHCLTGIDLAEEINNRKSIDNALPIIFLSKTEINEKNRIKKYDAYLTKFPENKCTIWIHKGYFGDEILEGEYFEKEVIKKIESLLPKVLINKVIEIIRSKMPYIDSASTMTHRNIYEISNVILKRIQNNEISINNDTLNNISTSSSESEYLNVLNSLNNNG